MAGMKWTQKAEKAFTEFESADISPGEYLALRWDTTLDNKKFTDLQNQTRCGDKKKQIKAAEELIKMTKHLKTPIVLDGFIAFGFSNSGEHERSLEARLEALRLTPAWHPNMTGQVVGNVGWSLQQLGELEGSRQFYERTLTWDPTNPFVLSSIAEIFAQQDQMDKAWGIRAYLESFNYPADHMADLVKLMKGAAKPANIAPYDPGSVKLRRSSFRDWARLVACCWVDHNLSQKEKLRAQSLGCAWRGQFAMARIFAQWCEDEEFTGFEKRKPLEKSWAAAIAAYMAASGEQAEYDGDKRLEAYEKADAEKNLAGLAAGLYEVNSTVRVFVASRLQTEDALVLIEEQAALEEKSGTSTQTPQDGGATGTLYRLQVKAAGRQPLLIVPAEGAAHPVFQGKLDKREGIVAWATFPGLMDDEDTTWFAASVQRMAQQLIKQDKKEKGAQIKQSDNGQTIQVMITKLNNPAAAVQAIIDAFGGRESRLYDLVIGRFEVPDGKKNTLFHHAADPRFGEDACEDDSDGDEWWERSFDLDQTPPPPEPCEGPSFMMIQSSEGHVPEVRLMPIRFDDVRVIYGLGDVEYRQGDKREAEVRAALKKALDMRFRKLPPPFFNREAEEEKSLDCMESHGRKGFAFAALLLDPKTIAHYPQNFRIRELEMLQAVRDVVLECKLAPVIHWYRGEGRWIFNVWEKE
jgi:tetratricopeptide (TPR) repeat protein